MRFYFIYKSNPNLFLSQWNAEEAEGEVLVQKPGSQFFFFFKSLIMTLPAASPSGML
jgi:hypothetical protein